MANVVLEALAAGLPVMTTDIYGNRNLVEPGRNGILLPPADAGAVARAIDLLVENPTLLRALGNTGRGTALGRSWEKVSGQYYRSLTVAANGQPKPELAPPGYVS